MINKLVNRPRYLDWLKSWRDKNIIKVVAGVRRCGKSTLFKLYIDSLIDGGVTPEQIISVNLEELEHEDLLNYRSLYEYITERLHPNGYTYVFIDEIQNCKDYEKAVDSLVIKNNIDVYITGSNAWLLSGELATLLSGRYVKIDMLPLSFGEYMSGVDIMSNDENVTGGGHDASGSYVFDGGHDASGSNVFGGGHSASGSYFSGGGHDINGRKTIDFASYLRYGAFPAILQLGNNDALINSYLDGVYNSISAFA